MNSGKGSIVLLVYTLVCYSYAAVMLFVFYYLPKKSGLVIGITMSNEVLYQSFRDKDNMTKSLQV